mmetsp:Transcript_36008/g.80131  ORF Transcript_36008/g.80131 Transcript_36008/m.80131 type:complete len:248 (+) Transcript_36008:1525-2268(+)
MRGGGVLYAPSIPIVRTTHHPHHLAHKRVLVSMSTWTVGPPGEGAGRVVPIAHLWRWRPAGRSRGWASRRLCTHGAGQRGHGRVWEGRAQGAEAPAWAGRDPWVCRHAPGTALPATHCADLGPHTQEASSVNELGVFEEEGPSPDELHSPALALDATWPINDCAVVTDADLVVVLVRGDDVACLDLARHLLQPAHLDVGPLEGALGGQHLGGILLDLDDHTRDSLADLHQVMQLVVPQCLNASVRLV